MSTSKTGLEAILGELRQGPERSPLFWWMLDNFRELSQAAQDTRIRWEPLRVRFQELGLLDGAGKTPTAENARQTWWRVRRVVESRESAKQLASRAPVQPSRLPVTSRPPVVEPPRPVEQPRHPPADRSKEPAVELNDAARETLASLRQQLEHSDRFLFMPKRKD